MVSVNSNLYKAKNAKNDEFYTLLPDIEKELYYYTEHFKGKHIFMNCDDPEESNFWRFFALNFHRLGLKQITSTHYNSDGQSSYRMDMYKDVPNEALDKETFMTLEEWNIDMPLGYITRLEGNGDFRSEESISILEEADIVVTNPPFSLFRSYVKQLMDYEKKFIIIGNQNAIAYREIFPLLKNGDVWLGVKNAGMTFKVPNTEENKKKKGYSYDEKEKQAYLKLGNVCWYTNLDHSRLHEDLILYKQYNPVDYPSYNNYKAIEVGKVVEIPVDYDGVIGVPVSFLCKHNPDQFEIVGISKTWAKDYEFNKHIIYTDALQHNSNGTTQSGSKVNDGSVILYDTAPKKGVYYTASNVEGYLKQTFPRLFIKRKVK